MSLYKIDASYFVAERTICYRLIFVFGKLGARNRTRAARRQGLPWSGTIGTSP